MIGRNAVHRAIQQGRDQRPPVRAPTRSGGFIFAVRIELPRPPHPFKAKWCGATSHVTPRPSAFARPDRPSISLRSVDTCCTCRCASHALARSRYPPHQVRYRVQRYPLSASARVSPRSPSRNATTPRIHDRRSMARARGSSACCEIGSPSRPARSSAARITSTPRIGLPSSVNPSAPAAASSSNSVNDPRPGCPSSPPASRYSRVTSRPSRRIHHPAQRRRTESFTGTVFGIATTRRKPTRRRRRSPRRDRSPYTSAPAHAGARARRSNPRRHHAPTKHPTPRAPETPRSKAPGLVHPGNQTHRRTSTSRGPAIPFTGSITDAELDQCATHTVTDQPAPSSRHCYKLTRSARTSSAARIASPFRNLLLDRRLRPVRHLTLDLQPPDHWPRMHHHRRPERKPRQPLTASADTPPHTPPRLHLQPRQPLPLNPQHHHHLRPPAAPPRSPAQSPPPRPAPPPPPAATPPVRTGSPSSPQPRQQHRIRPAPPGYGEYPPQIVTVTPSQQPARRRHATPPAPAAARIVRTSSSACDGC